MSAIKGNPEFDFKEQNPIISQLGSFKEAYKKHKPDIASKICWTMWMIEEADQEANPLARIVNREERIKEVQSSYYKIDTESELYKSLTDDYSRLILSKEEALYKIHVSKFEELTTHLKSLSLDTETDYKKYIEIMKGLPLMWKGLEIVREQMIDSKNKNRIRGGAQLSAREKRRK
jgi:hypothetical protein